MKGGGDSRPQDELGRGCDSVERVEERRRGRRPSLRRGGVQF